MHGVFIVWNLLEDTAQLQPWPHSLAYSYGVKDICIDWICAPKLCHGQMCHLHIHVLLHLPLNMQMAHLPVTQFWSTDSALCKCPSCSVHVLCHYCWICRKMGLKWLICVVSADVGLVKVWLLVDWWWLLLFFSAQFGSVKEYNIVVREEPVYFYFGNNVWVCIIDDMVKSVGQSVCKFDPLSTRLKLSIMPRKVACSVSNGLLMVMLKSPSSNSLPLEFICFSSRLAKSLQNSSMLQSGGL